MITNKSTIIFFACLAVAFISCEKEKIEYKTQYSGSFFRGFAINSNFIIHDESISYYNADSNKVFSNLFEHQNGRKLGNAVHSLKFFRNWQDVYGIITVEGENMIEIVDKNFISVKQIPLYKPRNISIAWNSYDEFVLISYGDADKGGIAVFAPWDFTIVDTVKTGNTAGEIYVNDYIYVSSNGENEMDSTIAKIHYGDSPFSLQKVEDIYVGKRPVIASAFTEKESGFYNQSILIHCLGTSVEEPKIVLYDLVRNEAISYHSFNPDAEHQEHILSFDMNKNELIYNANNKVYLTRLKYYNISPTLISDYNITSMIKISKYSQNCFAYNENNNCMLKGWFDYFVGISGENNSEQQYLYRFTGEDTDNPFFEKIDSIAIDSKAKNIIQRP